MEISIGSLNTSFLGIESPTFNEKSPSVYPVRVVVEVLSDEVDSNKFQSAGFHLLVGVAQDDANLSKFQNSSELNKHNSTPPQTTYYLLYPTIFDTT